jgi:hypothetical protein
MSVIRRLSSEQIYEYFTHEGWFYLCPVYLGNVDSNRPRVHEKNWVPRWWLEFNTLMVQSVNIVLNLMGHDGFDFSFKVFPLPQKPNDNPDQ